jgi:cell division protein FtsB
LIVRRLLPQRGLTRRRAGRKARPVLTPRALVLGALIVLLVVVLASPLHHYLGSRHDVSSAAQQLHRDQQALQRLTSEQAKWSDPGYVQRQARLRLQYAMPGDTVYTVVGPGETSSLGRAPGAGRKAAGADTWTTRLWHSVQAAGG